MKIDTIKNYILKLKNEGLTIKAIEVRLFKELRVVSYKTIQIYVKSALELK